MDHPLTRASAGVPPGVALVPWGTPFEEFLDPLERTIDDFCERLDGGWLFGYAVALARAGYEPTIVLSSRSTSQVCRRVHLPTGTPMVLLPGIAAGPAAASGSAFRRELSRYRRSVSGGLLHELAQYDAVLVQEYEEPRADILAWWGLVRRIPVLATFQGGLPPWDSAPVQRLVRSRSMRRLAGLISGSVEECDRVVEVRHVHPSAVHRVPNPVDLKAWEPQDRAAARQRLDISPDALVVAWHGRVDIRRKGIDILLDAWTRVCSSMAGSELCLLLAGNGPDAGEMRALLESIDRSHGVRWLCDYAPAEQVRERLAACDLWVSASRHEGFAVAPLEAMSSGRAILLTDVPGAAELIDERLGDALVPAGDAAALAAAIVTALSDRDRLNSAGVRNRRRAEDHFSERAVGQRLGVALAAAGCPTSIQRS